MLQTEYMAPTSVNMDISNPDPNQGSLNPNPNQNSTQALNLDSDSHITGAYRHKGQLDCKAHRSI